MSGHCDFCQIFHSGSCCHPGRARLAALQSELAKAQQSLAKVTNELAAVRKLAEGLAAFHQEIIDMGQESSEEYSISTTALKAWEEFKKK